MIKKADLYKTVINCQPRHIFYKVVFMLFIQEESYENRKKQEK